MSKIIRIIVTMLCTVCLFTGSVMAATEQPKIDEIEIQPVVCNKGCSGLSILICRKKPYLDGSSTHTRLGKQCTILWYMDRYTGFVCPTCGNLQTTVSLNMGYGDHDCYQVHGSCGAGTVKDCKHGTVG